jgi:hypothetical protein
VRRVLLRGATVRPGTSVRRRITIALLDHQAPGDERTRCAGKEQRRTSSSNRSTYLAPAAGALLSLQRAAGNRATARWLKDRTARPVDPTVQRILSEPELRQRGADIQQIAGAAPQTSANLWKYTDHSNTELYVIGTVHGHAFAGLAKRKQIFDFLTGSKWDNVYGELASTDKIDIAGLKGAIESLPEPPKPGEDNYEDKLRQYPKRTRGADNTITNRSAEGLDVVYGALATNNGTVMGLETQQSRDAIRAAYVQHSPLNKDETRLTPQEEAPMEGYVQQGNQPAYMATHAQYLTQGIDPQDIEGRNEQWAAGVVADGYHLGKRTLWIVGASHLAGLSIELRNKGWTVQQHNL